jgi:hypothetical protein
MRSSSTIVWQELKDASQMKRPDRAAAKRAEGKPVSFKITSAADIDIN